jgi:hypothetical protein
MSSQHQRSVSFNVDFFDSDAISLPQFLAQIANRHFVTFFGVCWVVRCAAHVGVLIFSSTLQLSHCSFRSTGTGVWIDGD